MVTVTGLTAARMLAIEAASVIAGVVTGNNLILQTRGGQTINAGNVRGPQGPQGIPGTITASPAGGDLAGNYPDPQVRAGSISDVEVAVTNKDGASNEYCMRTLGPGAAQAAAGNHTHSGLIDTGWTNFVASAGSSPFAGVATDFAQWRKVGRMVHVRFSKTSTAARDMTGNLSGNFANLNVLGVGSLPPAACPDTTPVLGHGRIDDTPTGLALRPDGSVVWYGGFGRLYASGSVLTADFMFLTNAGA